MTCPPCTNDCNEGRTCPARSGNEIIDMARQAGFFVKDNEAYSPSVQEDHELTSFLEAFAALVAAKERERIIAANAPELEKVNAHIKRLEEQAYDLVGELRVANIKLSMRPPRTWAGLTDEDISEIVRGTHNTGSFVRAIEAKLKEKNT